MLKENLHDKVVLVEVKNVTDLEWNNLIKTNNHVIEHDDEHYIIREFQRTECERKYFYLKNGSYAEKIAMIDGKIEFNIGDTSTHTFDLSDVVKEGLSKMQDISKLFEKFEI